MSDKDTGSIASDLMKGEYPLVEVFWIYYFLPVIALHVLSHFLGGLLSFLINLVALLLAGFMVIPIWKSADNYQGISLFRMMAKIAVVIIGLKVVFSFPIF